MKLSRRVPEAVDSADVGETSPLRTRIAIIGALGVVLAATASERLVVGGAQVRWTLLMVIALGVASHLMDVASIRRDLRTRVAAVLPLLILFAIDLAVRAATAMTYSQEFTGQVLYLISASVLVLSLLAALQIGSFCGTWRPRVGLIALAAISGVTFVVALLQFAGRYGLLGPSASNPLGPWDAHLAERGVAVWTPGASEFFRAVALGVNPNGAGALGLACYAFAASATIVGRRSRAWVGAVSVGVILMSGSRAALLGFVGVTLALLFMNRSLHTKMEHINETTGDRSRSLRSRWALVAAVVLVASLPLLSPRTWQSLEFLDPSGHRSRSLPRILEGITNGRFSILADAWGVWLRDPMGAYRLPEPLVGVSIHNEFMERLIWGGPLMLLALVGALTWLAVRVRPTAGPGFGIAAAAAWGITAVSESPTHTVGFALPLLFGLGFLLGLDSRRSSDTEAAL